MALGEATQQSLRDALSAVDEHYTRRLGEIEREVRNLEARGEPLSDLGDNTTDAGADQALVILAKVNAI